MKRRKVDPISDLARMHAKLASERQRAHSRGVRAWGRKLARDEGKRRREKADKFVSDVFYYLRVLGAFCVILAMVSIEMCKDRIGIR